MSVRDFAARLGVSDRAVSKWEAGGEDFVPRPDSQAMLDTMLEKAPQDARTRFVLMLGTDLNSAASPSERPTGVPWPGEHESPTSDDGGQPRRITHPIDGKVMVLVAGGPFPAGPDNRPELLPAFYMDVYPVTNKDYAEFVKRTGRSAPSHWPGGIFPSELADHPVVNVTYLDARDYSAWAGKALPSALEWEKAARGPEGNIFPWGDQETPVKCNVRQARIGTTTPVDRYHSGISYYDIYDMAGNVWEWCGTETDAGRFVLKGSAFTSPLGMASGAAMNDASETMLDDDTGFRCVSSLDAIRELLRFPS